MYVCDGVRFFRHPWSLVLYAKVVSASTAKTSARRVSLSRKNHPHHFKKNHPPTSRSLCRDSSIRPQLIEPQTESRHPHTQSNHPPSYRHHHQPAWQFISPHTHYSITPLAVSNKSLAVISRLSKMGGRRVYINRRRTPYRR